MELGSSKGWSDGESWGGTVHDFINAVSCVSVFASAFIFLVSLF